MKYNLYADAAVTSTAETEPATSTITSIVKF